MKRIAGFDSGKGIAVLGMMIAHTFEGGICQWSHDVELSFLKTIKVWVLVLLSPLSIILMMGLFFTFISSITCSLSVLSKEKYGDHVILQYIFYRLVFAIVLKGMEIILTTWWKQFDPFDLLVIQLPIATIPRSSHTLDSVGACGWIVPFVVFIVRKIHGPHHILLQISLLSSMALLLLVFYQPIALTAMDIAYFFEERQMNGLSILFSKIGSGPFMIAQCLPFGIIGGAIAIMLYEYPTCKQLWKYDFVFTAITAIIAFIQFLFTDHFFDNLLEELKPPPLRMAELVVELNIIVLGLYLCEDPRQPVQHRALFARKGTFLRRISYVSLTIFIFEQYICRLSMKMFKLFFGEAVDIVHNVIVWNPLQIIIYMACTTGIELGIVRIWEFGSFRLSCEHLMELIMGFLLNRTTPQQRDFRRVVYGPNELFDEASNKRKSAVSSSLSSVLRVFSNHHGH